MTSIPSLPTLKTAPLPELRKPEGPAQTEPTPAPGGDAVPVDLRLPGLPFGPAAPTLEFLQDTLPQGPGLAEIKNGEILAPGQRGPAVPALRALLTEAGYAVPLKGENMDLMDELVVAALSRFQLTEKLVAPDSPHKGLLGPTTLARLQKEAAEDDYDPEAGKRIAKAALKAKLNDHSSGRQCYAYAANYIEHGVKSNFLTGLHAYMAADQLAKSPYFKEEKVSPANLKDLPDGAVIVYAAQGGHRSGHIDVVATHPKSSARLAISDFTRPLEPSPWGNVSAAKVKYRVFLPVEKQ